MTQTTNYKLDKPAGTDVYDISVPNGNMDKIDTALAERTRIGTAAPAATLAGHVGDRYYDAVAKKEYVYKNDTDKWVEIATAWGFIKGTLADQTDLKNALDAKADSSALSTEATTRANADTALGSRITTETSNRELEDNALSAAVNTKLDATKATYQTTAPTAAATDGGIHIVFLAAEPATKYDGYIYLIAE